MPGPDNISKLYNELRDTYDVGSEDDFRKYLSDSGNREALRKDLEGDYDVGDSASFSSYLGFDGGGNDVPAKETSVASQARYVADVRARQAEASAAHGGGGWLSRKVDAVHGTFDKAVKAADNGGLQESAEADNGTGSAGKGGNSVAAHGTAAPSAADGGDNGSARPASVTPVSARPGESGRKGYSVNGFDLGNDESLRKYLSEHPLSSARFVMEEGGRLQEFHSADELIAAAERRDKEARYSNMQKYADDLLVRYDPDNVAEAVWRSADERARMDMQKRLGERSEFSLSNVMRGLSSQNATGGLAADNFETGVEAMASHLKYHDLQRMADDAWNMLGKEKQQSVIDGIMYGLRWSYPDAGEEQLREEASALARQRSDQRVFELAVEKNAPKSATDYFFRKVLSQNALFSLMQAAARSQAGTTGDWEAREDAEQRFEKQGHKFAGIAGTVAGFALDPLTWASAGAGGAAVKGTTWLGGKMIGEAAMRKFGTTLGGRMLGGAIGGAVNFGTYEAGSEALDQMKWGGYIDDETGERKDGFSLGRVAGRAGHGLMMGAATGVIAPYLGNVSDKLVRATESTVGKMGVRVGELGVSTVAEGTIFSIPEWINGDRDALDVWTDNMAMIAGFKAQHLLKSAPRVIGELAASRKGKAGFETRLRSILDGRDDLALTSDEKRELERGGYDDLLSLVEDYEATTDAQQRRKARADSARREGYSDELAEQIASAGEPLPYNRYTQLMSDGRVSEAARAKMYYYLTGRTLPMSTVMGSSVVKNKDADGNVNSYTVQSIGANGVITSRTFGSKERADVEVNRINRQAELNGIDVGERAYNDKYDRMRMYEACRRMSKETGAPTDRLYDLMQRKPETMNDVEALWADRTLKEYEALGVDGFETTEGVSLNDDGTFTGGNSERVKGLSTIRAEIGEEFGVDVDKAIRKEPGRRSEQEQKAAREYANRLFADVKRKQEEAAERGEAPASPDAPTSNSQIAALLGIDDGEQGDPVSAAFNRGHEADAQERQDIAIELADPNNAEAQEAWNGVVQRINEDAAYMVAQQREQTRQMQHTDGSLRPAILKEKDSEGNDQQVYIVDGNVQMMPDGSMVDKASSDNIVVVYNPVTGERKQIDPTADTGILSVGEVTTAEQHEANIERSRQEYVQAQIDEAQGTVRFVPGQQLVLPTGEEAVVVATDADGENITVALGDGTQATVQRSELQRIRDEKAAADYRERHGIDEAAMPSQHTEQPHGVVAGAPTDYTADMELTIRDEDGSEKPAMVMGRVRYENGSFVPDANGNIIEYFMDGEVKHDHEDKLVDKVVSHVAPQQPEAAPVQEASAETPATVETAPPPARQQAEAAPQQVQEPVQTVEPQPAQPADAPAQPTEQPTAEPMPVREDGEEDWQATTPERAHAYIFNEAGLSRSEGNEFVAAQTQAAQKALAKAQSAQMPKVGTSIKKYNEAKAKRQEKIDEAQRVLDYWNGVREIQNTIQREENERRAAEDAVRHDEAVAEAQAEYEARKQAEAERKAVGNENPMPAITEKWNNATKVDGHRDEIMLPDGTPLKGHYVLHESGASSPSHNPETWQKTDGFPMDANDNSVNDRDYERDHDAQEHTQSIARQYDQRALQSVPVVSNDGVVLSGNGRTMAGELAARDNTDGAYVNYLKEYAPKFGFTAEQVGAMQHPRVSFVPDEAMPYTAETFAKFNQQEMKSQNKTEQAVKLGKTVSDDSFKGIVRTINGYDTLGDFYNDAEASLGAVYDLHNAGVVPQAQLAEMVDGVRGQEKLSAVGREFLENMLIGKAFESDPEVVRMLTAEPAMRQTVITALGEIVDNIALGGDWSLQGELADAVKLCFDARQGGAKYGEIVSTFARQGVLFADPDELQTVADFNNATMLMLADVLNDKRVTLLKTTLQLYNNNARQSVSGQTDLFAGGIQSREDILRDVITFINENYGKRKEIEAARAEAVERRKAESVQQDGTPPAVGGRSEGGSGGGTVGGQGALAPSEVTAPLSNETNEFGKPFVVSSDGTTVFGEIDADAGLTAAPIKLSLGENNVDENGANHGYGLLHIEAGHGDQIRKAGFKSVEEFVEHVARNYDTIRLGSVVADNQTYLLEVSDIHNNTLFIQLSRDGSYWNINSAGIFKKKYSRNKPKVFTRPALGDGTDTDSNGVDSGQSLGATAPAGDSPQTSVGKGSENSATVQGNGKKSAENQTPNAVQAALAAAEHETNTEPTEAQKEAGNYKKGHVKIDGYDVTIENPKGSIRRGTDASGKQWEQEMQNTYGYIRGTEGVDGDHIDVFFSDDPSQGDVFVVDQVNKDGSFDEHKVMYGFPDIESARKAYLSNYEDGWQGLGAITPVSKEEFKKWIDSSHRKTKPFAEYSSVKPLGDTQLGEQPNKPTVKAGEEGELAFVSMRKYQAKKSGVPNEAEASTLGSSAKISSADSESPVATNKSLAGSATDISAGKGTDLFGNEQGKVKKSSSEGKIDDVGEVLAGARKDMRSEIAKSLSNVTEAALVEKPFGKVYKKPDLKKAVESGALREKDAIFYEALFSTVNQQKPKVTQSEMRSKRYIPGYKTKAERWAADTFKQMEVLRQFMELDEPGRDAMMERMLADRYPTREQELAEIEKRKGWNPDYEGHKYEWGEMTTPNPLWVTHEVMNRLGYNVGDKMDVPYGVVKANTSGTGYSIENLKGERASLFGSGMTLDEAIDRIVYLAKLKRGDADVSHPTQLFAFPATKSESGESGRYRVMWGRDYKTREFDSKDEADAFAQTKNGAYVSPIMETKRMFGYKVRFTHPLTGEKMFVDDAEFDTKEEAQAYFDGNFEKINDATNAKLQEEREKKGEKKTLTADDVVHVTMVHSGKGGWTHAVVIDKKYANNDGQVRIIKEGFASRKDAKAFADGVKDDVLKTVLKHKEDAKKIVYFDTGENSRIGEDYRMGKDVDAEDFMNTFGFRGVQFGNWTNQADRQMAVNQAYDAFMDMARLIGVSPKAMSLNGELGIAFGARGVGGFAAHYEPDEVVINLTKTNGAGSLAHEWWHALDNYFARRAGSAGDMVTDNRRIEMRDALRKAFNDMLDLVNGSDYAQRSAAKGEYWGRTHEVTARLLAEWVDRELKMRGELNTFLSRGAVVERGQQHNYNVYEVLERLAGREPMPFEDYMELSESLKGIPYPSAKEVEQFGGSLRHIFDTLEEQVDEETGNVMLYEPAATYETRDGGKVVCRSLFDELGVRSGDEVAMVSQHTQQGQGQNQVIAPSEIRLRKLKKGETCHVERVYEETKQFDFTGKEKVESAEDVAYIFRQLENAAVENSFLVLVKDGRPTVIHLGVGSYIGVMAPYEQAFVAYKELNPDQVYFVHNHPSGTLKASRQDQDLLKRIKMAFGEDVVQQGIIIDTTSGKYGEFDMVADNYDLVQTSGVEAMPQSEGADVPVKVYQFSRQVFAPDWNPESAFKIVSSQSVAEFVSSHRLGEHKKMSFLVVNNSGNVVANVFLPWTKLSDIKRSKDAGDLLAGYVHQCGGVRGVLYGNYDYEPDDHVVLAAIGGRMRQLHAPLMDALHVEHSAYEHGWAGVGEPKEGYGVDARQVAQQMDERNGTEVVRFVDYLLTGELKAGDSKHFYVGDTGDILNGCGIDGKITVSTTAVNGHHTSDNEHLNENEWVEVFNKINEPIAVTKYGDNGKSYRIYTVVEKNGKSVCVGVDVKNVGRDVNVTSIRTAFARDIARALNENLLYPNSRAELETAIEEFSSRHNREIYPQQPLVDFPEQEALLRGLDYREYPSIQELSAANIGNNSEINKENGENVVEDTAKYRIREDEPPTKTGIGYKVFVLKDGKLYPPMVANPNGEATPVGVWLDADAAPVAGVTKTGRQQVKAGGKGTQGGSGKLAYRPGWHLGEIPYALQFNRMNPETGQRELFPANFVWAEVEYANDVDYQEEAMSYGMNASGKFQHSLAGLPRLPENGSYRYRTNPDPNTDPWVITGAMKVNRILKPSEVDAMVEAAGREPQQRQAGAITDEQVEALNAKVKRTMQEDRDMMRSAVQQMGEKLHTDINIIEDVNEITHPNAAVQERRRKSKGWYDTATGQVNIVLPNNRDIDDVKASVGHETIAHKGLRELVGEENYDEFLDETYQHLRDDLKKGVDDAAGRAFVDDATKNGERAKSYEQHRRTATDELFGRMAEKPFEEFSEGERSLWQKIKATVRKLLDKFLGSLKLPKWFELGDNELRYILWRSKERLERGKEHPIDLARDIVKREELGLTDEARYNMGDEATDLDNPLTLGHSSELDVSRSTADLYRDPDETEDIWSDRSMGLQERITAAATRLASNHREDKTLRNDAMRAICDNLADLAKSMLGHPRKKDLTDAERRSVGAKVGAAAREQLRFDVTTVKRVADLARVLMKYGYLDGLSQQDVKRLLGAVRNSVGHDNIEGSVQNVMDIMVDNMLRRSEATLDRLGRIQGSKVDARGVEVQGELDPAGAHTMKVFKKTRGWERTDIEEAISEAQQRMGSSDVAVADEAALEYTGLQLALEYAENIKDSKVEERKLREEIKQAHDDASERDRATDSYRQYIASLQDAIRQNKIERVQSYFNLVGRLTDSLRESIANAKDFKEAEKQRIREIQHNANSDMEGRPSDEHYKPTFADKFVNNSFVSFLFAPLATFDQMLRMFGGKSANGEGYLYNRFMRGWIDARQQEINGVRDKYAILDAKAAELFGGKVKTWGDLIRRVGKLPKGTVSFWNGGEMQERELTQGNLMYIYMVNKMLDGRMKLRKMGITEEKVADIEEVLDPRLTALADWLQDEFLVQTRNEYNETHKRMFGASMAAIEHYFPLKILANARADKPEDLDNPDKSDGISTATGSIIKRRRNALALDITGADALSVILDHVAQMEHWNAFAEFNRDINTLRTYKRFRNQVQNMTTIYGSGKELWKKFNDVCQMAAGTYRPPRTKLDEAAVNFAKGVTAAKVSFRMFTALKQFLSMPAYIPEARTDYLLRNIANPAGAWKWSMEHLPIFNERWNSRMSGDPRLLKSDMDWKMWRTRLMQLASRAGMSPNAFVDALTVSIGAYSMYQTRLAQYLRDGYSEADAEKKAVQDAEVLYNQTQQSSEGAFTSTMQVDRSWLSVLFTVFRNASMSYQRQLHDALRNFKHNLTPGGRARSIEFMTKQLLRDKGIEPQTDGNWSDADWQREEQVAKRKFRRQLLKDTLRVATFGYIMQLAWNLGAYLPYLLFGDDEDEKQKMWDDVWAHTAFGSVEGLTGGDLMSQAGQMMLTGEGNPAYLSKDMPLTSDIMAAFQKLGNGQHTEALNDMINLIVQAGLGVNPQSITDVALSIMDACGDDPALAHEATICISRILQVPQSQIDKMYFDEVGLSGDEVSKYTPAQLAERYAQFKVKRGRFFSPWSWGDEERIKKFTDKANKTIKERTEQMGDDKVNEAYERHAEAYKEIDARIKDMKMSAKSSVGDDDRQMLFEDLSRYMSGEDGSFYKTFKACDKVLGNLAKKYLASRSAAESALCRETLLHYKAGMVRLLDAEDSVSRDEAMRYVSDLMDDFRERYVMMHENNR